MVVILITISTNDRLFTVKNIFRRRKAYLGVSWNDNCNIPKVINTHDWGTARIVGIAVSESALCPPKYSFSTFLICFLSFSLSFFVRSSYFFWFRSASFWAFSFLDSTFFLKKKRKESQIHFTSLLITTIPRQYSVSVNKYSYNRTCFALFGLRPLCPNIEAPAISRAWLPIALPWGSPNPKPIS